MSTTAGASATRLQSLGWGPWLESALEPFARDGLDPGRVTAEHRGAYTVSTEAGDVSVQLSGRLRHEAAGRGDLPAVGDWVVTDGESVHAVLPRRSAFSRKAAWRATEEQVVAANVDVVFLVCSLVDDLSLRRLERYLIMAWESGAEPVVVLTKTDLCDDVPQRTLEVQSVALGVPVHPVSCVTGDGFDALTAYAHGNRTIALLGSSGAGKSTLLNRLLGRDLMKTAAVRESDGRGRHTTSHRELVPLPGGGLAIDTPGMRELQLWEADAGLSGTFEDVEALFGECRFGDCSHEVEPGCAVLQAIETGELHPDRLESYRSLRRELEWLERKQDRRAAADERRRIRNRAKEIRRLPR